MIASQKIMTGGCLCGKVLEEAVDLWQVRICYLIELLRYRSKKFINQIRRRFFAQLVQPKNWNQKTWQSTWIFSHNYRLKPMIGLPITKWHHVVWKTRA
jgi:hypothetical protein